MIGLYHKCGQWMTFFIFWTFITWMFWTFIYHPFWTILTPVRRAIEADFKITIFIRRSYSVEMDPSNPLLGPIKLWTFDFACNCNGRFDWGHVSYLDKHRLHHFWVHTWQLVIVLKIFLDFGPSVVTILPLAQIGTLSLFTFCVGLSG